jgi:hypothetical protein
VGHSFGATLSPDVGDGILFSGRIDDGDVSGSAPHTRSISVLREFHCDPVL